MTVEQQVDALTTAVDDVKASVATKKAVLDATVVDAQANTALAQTAKTATLSARDQAAEFKDAAYTAAQSAASAVAYQDLTALALSKAVTAVDVFIYDTSKDSDGGAWRHRCAGTSWFNETLNTATRGSRREFPAVAVIVVTALNIYIYDGDDPSLPMWMVFTGGSSASGLMPVIAGGYYITSVAAAEAEICVAHGTGLFRCNFIADSGLNHEGAPYSPIRFTTGIAQRSAATFVNDSTIQQLVNRAANDVAMTVLQDAHVDPATGLPVPTIAVATAGGVSVIKDDGTVVDSASTLGFGNVSFDPEGGIYATRNAYGANLLYSTRADYEAGDSFGDIISSTVRLMAGATNHDQLRVADALFLGNGSISSGGCRPGLMRHLANSAAPVGSFASGMTCFTTSSYNTGWMNGDIKGAFLASTDATSLVGGSISTDTYSLPTGWSSTAGTLAYDGSGTQYSQPLNALSEPVVPGRAYRVRFTVTGLAAGEHMNLMTPGFTTSQKTFAADGTYEVYLIATTVVGTIGFQNNFAAQTFTVTDVSLDIADADRSVNNNGLIVNGTVTRSAVATGAELVAYSGFSASNYLEQPYNSDLDFGTGDFCVMGWVKNTETGVIFERRDAARTGPYINAYLASSTAVHFYAGTSKVAEAAIPSGVWFHLALGVSGGVSFAYVNGVSAKTYSGTPSTVTNNSALTRVGCAADATAPAAAASACLFRISATVPIADQIRRIYEDEKALFQENAACTLYGASDAVTALAHDPDTGLLHVGTSAGRSVFKGLRRVANTTVPVGAAIAAAGGMVVEQ